jgi:hypothetical protein
MGLDAAAAVAADLHGPHIDLTTLAGDTAGRIRLKAAKALNTRRYGWFEGRVVLVSPQGTLTHLCAIRGVTTACLEENATGTTHIRATQAGVFGDIATGRRSGSLVNPVTGAIVATPIFFVASTESLPTGAGDVSPWRIEGDRLKLDEEAGPSRRRVFRAAGFVSEAALTRSIELTWHSMAVADMQDSTRNTIRSTARQRWHIPAPSWLGLDGALGVCVIDRTLEAGFTTPGELPPDLAEFAAGSGETG